MLTRIAAWLFGLMFIAAGTSYLLFTSLTPSNLMFAGVFVFVGLVFVATGEMVQAVMNKPRRGW